MSIEPAPACAETMQLYRSIAGELSASEADAFALHLGDCASCRATKAEIEGAQHDLGPAPSLDQMRARPVPKQRWAVRGAVGLAAAAMVAAFFLSPDGLRTKGAGLDVELLVVRNGETIEATSFCPKDRLQPILRSSRAGLAYVFWIDGGVRSMAPPVRIAAGQRLVFPASFELDDAKAPERMVVAVSDLPEAELIAALSSDSELDALFASFPIEKDCRP